MGTYLMSADRVFSVVGSDQVGGEEETESSLAYSRGSAKGNLRISV